MNAIDRSEIIDIEDEILDHLIKFFVRNGLPLVSIKHKKYMVRMPDIVFDILSKYGVVFVDYHYGGRHLNKRIFLLMNKRFANKIARGAGFKDIDELIREYGFFAHNVFTNRGKRKTTIRLRNSVLEILKRKIEENYHVVEKTIGVEEDKSSIVRVSWLKFIPKNANATN